MNLQQLQTAFMARVHDPAAALPPEWDARMARGMEVYRNNYRHALLETMATTFERTRRWVGEEAFHAAAAHHLVAHPPCSWTLDAAGAGFAETAAGLFARDVEVGDLAALEWAMHRVFVAADSTVLDLAGFQRATAGFAGDDWVAMRLRVQPGLEVVTVGTDCVALWQGLSDDVRPRDPGIFAQPRAAIVWREEMRPVCRITSAEDGRALRLAAAGTPYGALCEDIADRHGAGDAARRAGAMLSDWLHSGLLAGVER